jgi:hypothetical protein
VAEATEPVKVETIAEVTEAVPAADGGNVWPDEAAESAFLAEARTNGETPQVATVTAAEPEVENETDGKELPPLDDLVKRIPPDVRDVLDDLFRAKFTGVRRVPKKSLKT